MHAGGRGGGAEQPPRLLTMRRLFIELESPFVGVTTKMVPLSHFSSFLLSFYFCGGYFSYFLRCFVVCASRKFWSCLSLRKNNQFEHWMTTARWMDPQYVKN